MLMPRWRPHRAMKNWLGLGGDPTTVRQLEDRLGARRDRRADPPLRVHQHGHRRSVHADRAPDAEGLIEYDRRPQTHRAILLDAPGGYYEQLRRVLGRLLVPGLQPRQHLLAEP